MQLDTFDCIRKPLDSRQSVVAEASLQNNDVQIINPGPNNGIGLGDSGNGHRRNGAQSGTRWIIYCDQGFRDSG
jgi:hypothetical protein